MRTRAVIVVAALFSMAAVETASAQTQFFVAPLRAGVLDGNLIDADTAFVVSSTGIRRRANEPAGSADRHYITTARDDYMSSDWTYEITFNTSADAPDDVLFIGLGEGVADETWFNEPRNSLNFRIHQGRTAFDTGWRVDVAAHDTGFLSFPYRTEAGYLPGAAGGTHIARIRKIGSKITFEIVNEGIAVAIPDVTSVAPFLGWSPSRIFFGNASSGYSFSEVRILPEGAGWQ